MTTHKTIGKALHHFDFTDDRTKTYVAGRITQIDDRGSLRHAGGRRSRIMTIWKRIVSFFRGKS